MTLGAGYLLLLGSHTICHDRDPHCSLFDHECFARGPIPDSSLRLHHRSLFMKFEQLTIDGAEFGTEVPPGGIVWH